jgi:hypothetical protein
MQTARYADFLHHSNIAFSRSHEVQQHGADSVVATTSDQLGEAASTAAVGDAQL